MPSAVFRLAKKRDFDLLLAQGRWFNSLHFSLKCLHLTRLPAHLLPPHEDPRRYSMQIRYATSVTIKGEKRAVVRNRLRRRVRAVVYPLLAAGQITPGVFFLIIAKSAVLTRLPFSVVQAELTELLRQARLVVAKHV